MKNFSETQKALREPIDYKFRIQSINDFSATVVAYIDARQLQDRLDDVLGAENWQVKYEEKKGNLFAGIGIKNNDEWVWKFDCGAETSVEKEKGESSDSFKRAGVMWGVGRFLYSLEIIKLKVKKHTNNKNYPIDDKDNILWSAADLNTYCKKILATTLINNANTTEELSLIWNNNQSLHTDKDFVSLVTSRKKLLQQADNQKQSA